MAVKGTNGLRQDSKLFIQGKQTLDLPALQANNPAGNYSYQFIWNFYSHGFGGGKGGAVSPVESGGTGDCFR